MFQEVIGALLCLVALSKAHNEFGITTPEELQHSLGGRIIQGAPAVTNQFPHQGFLIITRKDGSKTSCGAALINSRWALTAGHCLDGAIIAEISLGSISAPASPINMPCINLHVHPDFNRTTLANDIGLIGFPKVVPFGSNIKPVTIATDQSLTHEGVNASVSGFGFTFNTGSISATLNFVKLRVISNIECEKSFGSIVQPSTICAAGINTPAQGVCNGDSGGPLVIGNTTSYTLIGIVSFVSNTGCSSSYPSGFVRPSHYIPWINEIIEAN